MKILVVCPNPSKDTFIWCDEFIVGGTNRIIKEKSFPGGKGVHVALGIAENGFTTKLLGFWGGLVGKSIQDECKARNISVYGPSISERSRICYTFKAPRSLTDTEILESGPTLKPKDISVFIKEFSNIIDDVDCVCLSGSWPNGSTPDAYNPMMEIARSKETPVFLDCADTLLVNALEKHPYLIHINIHEGAKLFKTDDPISLAEKLNEYCTIAAVTAGSNGLYLFTEGLRIKVSCKLSRIYSTVGSGDSLLAGLIAGYIRNKSCEEMAKWGVACASANCICEDLGIFRMADARKLYGSLDIKYLND